MKKEVEVNAVIHVEGNEVSGIFSLFFLCVGYARASTRSVRPSHQMSV
jgi:hypothetical protein